MGARACTLPTHASRESKITLRASNTEHRGYPPVHEIAVNKVRRHTMIHPIDKISSFCFSSLLCAPFVFIHNSRWQWLHCVARNCLVIPHCEHFFQDPHFVWANTQHNAAYTVHTCACVPAKTADRHNTIEAIVNLVGDNWQQAYASDECDHWNRYQLHFLMIELPIRWSITAFTHTHTLADTHILASAKTSAKEIKMECYIYLSAVWSGNWLNHC